MVFVSRIVIGIAGAGRRTGCTHTAIVLANFLRKHGQTAAVLEMGENGAFESFGNTYRIEKFEDGFTLNGIDFFPKADGEMLVSLTEKNYNFFVLDFGDYAAADREIFDRCDVKILCAGVKPWETGRLEKIFRETGEEKLQSYHFCFFGASGRTVRKEICRQMEPLKNLWFPAYAEDPFRCAVLPDGAEIFDGYFEQDGGRKRKIFTRG